MATDADKRRAGDPAFADSGAITHEPVVEEERPTIADTRALRRPSSWAVAILAAAFVALAILAGAAAGWAYAIPFVIMGALVVVFLATMRSHRRAPSDSESAVPTVDFDERD